MILKGSLKFSYHYLMLYLKTQLSDIMKIYKIEKTKTMKLIEHSHNKIVITINTWTYINFYMIQLEFIFLNFIIAVLCPYISSSLMECLLDWNIDRKLSTITIDNCSTIDTMISILLDKFSCNSLMLGGELFHMDCYARLLNLIVKNGLEMI
ncbi:unnamed protein product [Musa textilis]